jgi:hypothetical protein
MAVMAKKSDKTETSETPDHKRNAVSVRLPDDLAAGLKAYLKSHRVPPTSTAVFLVALREFLERAGFVKPQEDE